MVSKLFIQPPSDLSDEVVVKRVLTRIIEEVSNLKDKSVLKLDTKISKLDSTATLPEVIEKLNEVINSLELSSIIG